MRRSFWVLRGVQRDSRDLGGCSLHNCSVSTPLKLLLPSVCLPHIRCNDAPSAAVKRHVHSKKNTAPSGCQGLFHGCLFIPYRASFPGTLYALCTYSALFRRTFFQPQSTTPRLSLNQDVLLISVFIFSQSFALVFFPESKQTNKNLSTLPFFRVSSGMNGAGSG